MNIHYFANHYDSMCQYIVSPSFYQFTDRVTGTTTNTGTPKEFHSLCPALYTIRSQDFDLYSFGSDVFMYIYVHTNSVDLTPEEAIPLC